MRLPAALLICASFAFAAEMPSLILGTAWYPEQWPESRWEADLKLMKDAGMNMVRIGEFAWARMERREGQYDLDWMERAVALAAKHGMVTVIGTPSAAPPAWLTQKYPETLRVERDGRRVEHGNRAHGSLTSPRYRELARRMAEQMARRFGKNPNVVGWQIDNEYGAFSYDEGTRKQWQDWLRARYTTLDSLNEHWTTHYWSQFYTDWSQIPNGPGGNPSLALEWNRFVTDRVREFQRPQLEAIRANSEKRQFICSNFMWWYSAFDHYLVSEDLDLATWDNYVGTGHLDPLNNGIMHDLIRGLKRKNFWVMETQPGSVNWQQVNNALDKGEVRQMAWHAVGHGADAIAYWQWRTALSGQEQYHGTIVGVDGTPVPLYDEVAQIGREFAKAAPVLAGTEPQSDVAMLHTYDSKWAINGQRHHRDADPVALLNSWYRPLRTALQAIDVIRPVAALDKYKVLVAPGLNVVPAETAKLLEAYVRGGGHLVLGPRSAMKDEWNALWPQRQPGPLVDLLGARVEQFYALDQDVPVNTPGKARIWAEHLKPSAPDVEVLMRYGKSNGWLDEQPAAVTRKVGNGRITYVGAWLDDAGQQWFTQWLLKTDALKPALGPVPAGVEVSRRIGGGREAFIVVNHTTAAQKVALPRAMTSVLDGADVQGTLELPARGVAVLQAR